MILLNSCNITLNKIPIITDISFVLYIVRNKLHNIEDIKILKDHKKLDEINITKYCGRDNIKI